MPSEQALTRIEHVRARAHRASRAQYLAGKEAAKRNTQLGVPMVVLSAAVGTAIFGSLATSPSNALVVATGVTSLVVACLSALQTFFRFEQRAQVHQAAGAEYGALKRRLDVLLLSLETQSHQDSAAIQMLGQIVDEVSALEKRAPDVPDRLYDRARNEQDNDAEGL